MAASYVTTSNKGVFLKVRVIPKSSVNSIGGQRGDELIVKLTAPPTGGKANQALLKFLAKCLRVAPSSLSIYKGASARHKVVRISEEAGMSEKTVPAMLAMAE